MHALFFVLNETEYLDDVLAALVHVGVKGATILDSQGMGSALIHNQDKDIPVFGFLKSFLETSHPYNKTIFSILETEELVDEVVAAIKEVVGDINQPGIGMVFTVPVGRIYGI
ncbi:MAG TPA: P-II family nitrogen regulator [Clostridia bacterium]|nr:P-II family nitrogen regulator [Clostridia bacterium]